MKIKKTIRWTYVYLSSDAHHVAGELGYLTFLTQEGCQLYIHEAFLEAKPVRVVLTPAPAAKSKKKRKKKTS